MQLGSNVAEFFGKKQAEADRTELRSRTQNYQREMLELQRELNEQRGSDVAEDNEFYNKWQARVGETRTRYLEENQNGRIATDLENNLGQVDLNFSRGLVSHIAKETESYAVDTLNGAVATATSTAAANADDDSTVAQMRNEIIDSIKEYAEPRGVTGKALESMTNKALSGMHEEVIDSLIDGGDYIGAKEYFNEFNGSEKGRKNEIDGAKHSEIEELIVGGGRNVRTQDIADYVRDQEWSRDEALEYARKTALPDDRDEAVRRVKLVYAEKKQDQIDGWNTTQDNAVGIYMDSIQAGMTPLEAWNSIPPTVKKAMKDTHRAALYNMMQADARGSAVHTDPEAFLDLYEMATGTPEEKAKFRDKNQTNLRDYIGRLSTAHVAFFAKLQDDEDALAIASTMGDLKKEVATTAGYYHKKTGKRKDATGIFDLNARFDEELRAYTAETGRTPRAPEGRDIADRLKLEFLREGTVYGYNPVMAGIAEIEGVPSGIIDEIVFDITKALRGEIEKGETTFDIGDFEFPITGERPTEEQIQLFYEYKSGKRKMATPSTPPLGGTPAEGPALLIQLRQAEDRARMARGLEPKWFPIP
jgi:hypothetical protein